MRRLSAISALVLSLILVCNLFLPASAEFVDFSSISYDSDAWETSPAFFVTETFECETMEELFRAFASYSPDYRSQQEIDFSTSYQFYDQLDTEEQRSLYNQLLAYTPLSQSKPNADLTSLKQYTLEDYPDYNAALNDAWGDISGIAVSSFAAYRMDHPMEAFWTFGVQYGIGISSDNNAETPCWQFSIELEPNFADGFTKDTYLQMKDAMENAYDAIPSPDKSKSMYERLEQLHDAVCDAYVYDLDATYAHSAYSMVDKLAVCEGYAIAMKILCDREQIPCMFVTGDAYSSKSSTPEAHAWNVIRMDDGKWYGLDATWDDQDTTIYYDFFLSGSETVAKNFGILTFSESHVSNEDWNGTGVFLSIYPTLNPTAYDPNADPHVYGEWINEVPASCEDPGVKGHYHCSHCGDDFDANKQKIDDLSIPALGHTGGTATCHTKAVCTRCKQEYGEFDPKNHDGGQTLVGASEAGCETPGFTGNTVCSGCNQVLTQGTEIQPLGHTGGTATCHTKAVCTRCKLEYGEFDPNNHDGSETVEGIVLPDCETPGYTGNVVCNSCHQIKQQGTEVQPLGHTGGTATCHTKAVCTRCKQEYGEFDPNNHDGGTEVAGSIQPGCETPGYEGATVCSGCKAVLSYGLQIPALGHTGGTATCHTKAVCTRCHEEYGEFDPNNHDGGTEKENAKDPTCTEAGYTGDTVCSGCKAVLTAGASVKALGHTGGTATCHTKAVCTRCHEEYGEFDPNNHDGGTEKANAKDPTCTEAGYTGDTVCSGCKAVLTAGTSINALGHTGGTATCHTKAVCTRCHEEYGEFDPNNHDGGTEKANAKDSTCTEAGYTGDTVCSGCKAVLTAGSSINALGHTGGTATCHTKAVCTRCHEEYGEFDPNNHDGGTEKANAKDPTCTEAGYTGDTVCSGCKTVLTTGSDLDPLGHTGGTATCSKKAVCDRCHKEYGEFDSDHHDYDAVYTKPTTNSNGFTTYTCKDCGHSYVEYDDPDTTLKFKKGDVNGDGRVNAADYLLLKRIILRTATASEDMAARCDINGDGSVRANDYMLLKRVVLGTSTI